MWNVGSGKAKDKINKPRNNNNQRISFLSFFFFSFACLVTWNKQKKYPFCSCTWTKFSFFLFISQHVFFLFFVSVTCRGWGGGGCVRIVVKAVFSYLHLWFLCTTDDRAFSVFISLLLLFKFSLLCICQLNAIWIKPEQ